MALTDILFPVGRLVGGSVDKPETTNSKGEPLTVKSGANKGQPRVEFSFGVAFAKQGEQSWAQTSWGAVIYKAATDGYPNGEHQHPTFSWKVIDGDSQIPNKKGNKPCDREGYKGHWIVWFSGGMAPKLFDIIGNRPGDATRPIGNHKILKGFFVQVYGSTNDNKPSETPGVYINHNMVALAAYGDEIRSGPDANEVGFGMTGALPAGASTIPAGAAALPPATAAVMPGAAALPPAIAAVMPGAAPVAMPGAVHHAAVAAAAPIAVAPNAAYAPAAVAPAPMAPPAAPAPAAPPAGPVMSPTSPYTYQALVDAKWTEDQMRAHGYLM